MYVFVFHLNLLLNSERNLTPFSAVLLNDVVCITVYLVLIFLYMVRASADFLRTGNTPDPTLGQGGGAIYAAGFNILSVTASNFTSNTASSVNITDFRAGRGAGGAISINSDAPLSSSCTVGRVTISACRFADNHANSGGAVQLVGSGHFAQSIDSSSNISYGKYSASYLDSLPYASYSFCAQTSTYCTISDSSFDGNSALLGGGGVSVLQGYTVQLTNVSFLDESTPLYGGAIAVANGSAVFIDRCRFASCTANLGGAIYAVASSEAYIAASVMPQWKNFNIYPQDVYKLGRQMGCGVSLSNSSFVGNSAVAAGAAVYMSGDSQLVSQGNTFSGGQAGTQGLFAFPDCIRNPKPVQSVPYLLQTLQSCT